jgi:thioredoxin 1
MSMVIDTDEARFEADLPRTGLAVIDFSASWCGPCRSYAPVFAASAASNSDVAHLKVDIDAAPNLAGAFAVQSVPTTVFVRDRVVIGSISGALPPRRLAALMVEARAFDASASDATAHVNDAATLAAEGAVIVDVRTPEEFAAGSLPGARNIPLDELERRIGELDEACQILCLCRSGARSAAAHAVLAAAGFDAINLAGGMDEWNGAWT